MDMKSMAGKSKFNSAKETNPVKKPLADISARRGIHPGGTLEDIVIEGDLIPDPLATLTIAGGAMKEDKNQKDAMIDPDLETDKEKEIEMEIPEEEGEATHMTDHQEEKIDSKNSMSSNINFHQLSTNCVNVNQKFYGVLITFSSFQIFSTVFGTIQILPTLFNF